MLAWGSCGAGGAPMVLVPCLGVLWCALRSHWVCVRTSLEAASHGLEGSCCYGSWGEEDLCK